MSTPGLLTRRNLRIGLGDINAYQLQTSPKPPLISQPRPYKGRVDGQYWAHGRHYTHQYGRHKLPSNAIFHCDADAPNYRARELDWKKNPAAYTKNEFTTVLVATLATIGLTILIPTENASAATAITNISRVPCTNSDYLPIWWHIAGFPPKTQETRYATAGTFEWDSDDWLDAFSTGNNRIQFKSDGTWQPATPVAKYTYFQFPNHPGGVKWEGICIQ
ncbi:hypothetical protein [Streptomyces sp. NPDC052036]|uniref:hypothetical protein n=1 Tax=Streptomyces sp. NPDC052036 TaxID=3155171 RepID=UPI00343375D6